MGPTCFFFVFCFFHFKSSCSAIFFSLLFIYFFNCYFPSTVFFPTVQPGDPISLCSCAFTCWVRSTHIMEGNLFIQRHRYHKIQSRKHLDCCWSKRLGTIAYPSWQVKLIITPPFVISFSHSSMMSMKLIHVQVRISNTFFIVFSSIPWNDYTSYSASCQLMNIWVLSSFCPL